MELETAAPIAAPAIMPPAIAAPLLPAAAGAQLPNPNPRARTIDAVIETNSNAIDNHLASRCQRARLFALRPDRTELNHILWGFVHRARFALQGPSRLITSSVPDPNPRWGLSPSCRSCHPSSSR